MIRGVTTCLRIWRDRVGSVFVEAEWLSLLLQYMLFGGRQTQSIPLCIIFEI
jgi:hypothetical protein